MKILRPKESPESGARRFKSKWKKRLLIGVGVAIWLPPIQVLFLKWIDPPTTTPQLLWGVSNWRSEKQWISIRSIKLSDAPPDYVDGVLFAEDVGFFHHCGFDFPAISKSIRDHREFGTPIRGASTITQQCARSVFLWQGRSWSRKLLEAYYTIWMELFLSKERILEVYANVTEFGDGVYGLEAASDHFFSVTASELTQDQLARLISVMPSPKLRNPNDLNGRAAIRQQWILDRLRLLDRGMRQEDGIYDDYFLQSSNAVNVPTAQEEHDPIQHNEQVP